MDILSKTEREEAAIVRERTEKVKRKHEILGSRSYKLLDWGVKRKLTFLNFFRKGRLAEVQQLEGEISELTDRLHKLSIPGYQSKDALAAFMNRFNTPGSTDEE